jgi:transcriptional regulator NrdR family protein
MRCPSCGAEKTKVKRTISVTPPDTPSFVHRMRECPKCEVRFETSETVASSNDLAGVVIDGRT